MTRNSGEVVVIEEEEASVPAPVDRTEEPTAPKRVPPPVPTGRKSTIEVFNDELAALERPLEGEVEYFDEKPPSRWRQAGAFLAIVVIVGVGGAVLISRNRAAADAREQASPSPVVATGAAAPPSPALAAEQTPPAPEAPAAAADAPAADEAAADSAGEDSARPAPSTRSAWKKVRTKVGHAKHARSGSSKTTTHRTTKTKRTVIAKNTVSRRH